MYELIPVTGGDELILSNIRRRSNARRRYRIRWRAFVIMGDYRMKKLKNNSLIRLIRSGISPRRPLFVGALVSVMLFSLLDLMFPKLLQLFVDAVEEKSLSFFGLSLDFLHRDPNGIFLIPAAIVAFAVLRLIAAYLRSVLQTRLGQGALYDLRNRIYNTMQSLSFAYHDRNHAGTLISNVVEDVAHVSRFFEFGIFPLIESPLYIIGAYCVLARLCWPAAAGSLGMFAVYVIVVMLYFKYGKRFFARTKELFTEHVQLFTENIEGALVVKAYGKERQQERLFGHKADLLHRAILKETMVTSIMSQSGIYAGVFGIFVVIGIALVLMRRFGWEYTPGQLFMIFFLQSSLIPRVRMLGRGFDLLMRTWVTADRLTPLFSAGDYLHDAGSRLLPARGPGSLSVRDAFFSYSGRGHAIAGVSLDIAAGEIVGIVGNTGAGKSTLALLLCRFYDPSEGTVLLDGKDIRSYPVRTVRDQFSLVFQDTFLFSTSVRENIAYGKPDASFYQIVEAAKTARIHDHIVSMPEGYDTVIGEKGVTLSGGQRQRLSIARAILREPRFLVLDDCTSALDTTTEQAIVGSLNALRRTTTLIIIAHRYTSIARADRVFVLESGRLVEEGRPERLNRPGSIFTKVLQPHIEQGIAQ
ncbi:MAG: ATP-binding cassette domain-containing protein [Chitinivibrionales bacterium]|nr:ATP-binding cassette domain-containing protein [Chitinivibrionales bacterium]MBD3355889.1 ATP-binding cassette domain-containing protein [Chitinivibrionales bacterium]